MLANRLGRILLEFPNVLRVYELLSVTLVFPIA